MKRLVQLFTKEPATPAARLARGGLSTPSERAALRRLLTACAVAAATLCAGAVGYSAVDPGTHTLVERLFMSFNTISTIGFEETIPLSTDLAKIFTMGLGVAGIANLAFLTSAGFAWVIEVEANPMRRRRAMQKRIEKLSGHYVVCGAGRAGRRICDELAAQGKAYVCIDLNESALEAHPLSIKGDAGDEDTLEAAGVAACAGIFVATGDDAKNLMATLAARELAPGARIVARAVDERNVKRMSKAGADAVVCPDVAAGAKLAGAMLSPHAHRLIDELSSSHSGLEEHAIVEPEPGYKMADLLLSRPGCSPMALHRADAWQVSPSREAELLDGDVVILVAPKAAQP